MNEIQINETIKLLTEIKDLLNENYKKLKQTNDDITHIFCTLLSGFENDGTRTNDEIKHKLFNCTFQMKKGIPIKSRNQVLKELLNVPITNTKRHYEDRNKSNISYYQILFLIDVNDDNKYYLKEDIEYKLNKIIKGEMI